jgi:histidinol phosphatase-like PHP family hydrolase
MPRLKADEMVDLHTHSFLSDGELIPEELVRRVEVEGYRMLAVADHVGLSNAAEVIPQLVRLARSLRGKCPVRVLPGAEVTHVRPELIARAVALARRCGAAVVVGHGQTIAEPVLAGTNRALILAGVDIVAHPGLIDLADAKLAAERGVALEISGRHGHSYTNGHVLHVARKTGARLIYGSDGHSVGDYPTRRKAEAVAFGAGMTPDEVDAMFANAEALFESAWRKGTLRPKDEL